MVCLARRDGRTGRAAARTQATDVHRGRLQCGVALEDCTLEGQLAYGLFL